MTTIALPREEADRLFKAVSAVDNPEALIEGFRARSTRFRARARMTADVAYGDHVDEIADIFLPAAGSAAGPYPVHIFIHGGYWYQFGKDEWSFVAEALTAAGVIVIVPRYSLCPAVGIGEILQQLRRLLCWTHRTIGARGGDPGRMSVSGHSAGGHLAIELLMTDWMQDYRLPADILKGVVSISGLYDLRPIASTYVQEHVGLSAADAVRLSPILHPAARSAALTLAVAERDPQGFHLQLAAFDAAMRTTGAAPRTLRLPDTDHLTILHALSDADGVLAREVLAQLGVPSAGGPGRR